MTARPLSLCALSARVFAALAIFATATAAQTVTGFVKTNLNAAVVGATVEVLNAANNVTATTTATGAFTVVIAAGIYDIEVTPPTGSTLAAARKSYFVVVAGTNNAGTITLFPGVTLTGTVQLSTGQVVSGGDTDVVNALTGEKLFTPNDNTNALGQFSVVVPAGTYHVQADPLAGQIYVSARTATPVVATAGTVNVGLLVLQPGVALSATVRRASNFTGVADADIDVDDAVTGERIITPTDATGATGAVTVIVPPNRTYKIAVDPPLGQLLLGRVVQNVVVGATATSMGFVDLAAGVLVTGTVLGPAGAPLQGVDIDVDTVLGPVRQQVSFDFTFSNGTYQIVLAPGYAYDITFFAPAGQQLVAQRLANQFISVQAALPTVTLPTGVILSGTLTALYSSLPENEASVFVTNPTSGALVITKANNSNALGQYSIIVPTGTFNVRIRTRKGSLSQEKLITNVSIPANTVLNVGLDQVPIFVYALSAAPTEVQTITVGQPIFLHVALYNPGFFPVSAVIDVTWIDPSGASTSFFPFPPTISFAPTSSLLALFVALNPPATPPGMTGFPSKLRIRAYDPATLTEFDRDEVVYIQL